MSLKVGLVYYDDDPDKRVFRKVYPTRSNRELRAKRWITEGCDPNRKAVMVLVEADSEAAFAPFTGTP